MKEIYIVCDGKRIDLTEEQLKTLGIEVKKDPFARVEYGEGYHFILSDGIVQHTDDVWGSYDNGCFDAANYCTDKALMEQRALHETLNRLLWRYSMQHDGEKIDWSDDWQVKHAIRHSDYLVMSCNHTHSIGEVAFYTEAIARAAIEEVVKPFMEQHPEFKW